MRLMGIDYGDARVGIALTDPLKIIASPHCVLKNDQSLIDKISHIISDSGVEKVIVGWPLNSRGEMTEQTRKINSFVEILKKALQIPVDICDEDFTTADAYEAMSQSGIPQKKRKEFRDMIAASLILRHYLEIS